MEFVIDQSTAPILSAALKAARSDFVDNPTYNRRSDGAPPEFETNTTATAAFAGLEQVVTSNEVAAQLFTELVRTTSTSHAESWIEAGSSWIEMVHELATPVIRDALMNDPPIRKENQRRQAQR